MFKKILLFGLVTIIISVIVVSAYEDKFPRVAYGPPYMGGNSTYNQYFAQAVDTLHLTALIQNIPFFQDTDFNAAKSHHLNLVNSIEKNYLYSVGQYSMYQADRYNEPDYFQPPGPNNQIRFLSTKYDNTGHGRQIQDSTVNPHVFAWFVSKDSANDNRGYVLYSLWNETTDPTLPPGAIDYSREQDKDSGRVYTVIYRLKYPKNSTYSSDDTVARLQAYFYDGDTGDTLILDQRLLVYDTNLAGQYDTFRLSYQTDIRSK